MTVDGREWRMANSEERIPEVAATPSNSFFAVRHSLFAAIACLLYGAVASAVAADVEGARRAVRELESRRVQVFAEAARTVVCIFADREARSGGSGVLISPEGYGLTNFHVVQEFIETRRGYGGLSDGRLYPLRVLGIDPGGDIAMFKLAPGGPPGDPDGRAALPFAPLGDSDDLHVGQWVAAMGNPFVLAEDFAPTITLGVISGLHRYQHGHGNLLEYADCIQVSTSINPGNSGGPLFDMYGRVIGINGRASFEERGRVNVGLGYAVSINQVKRFLPGLRAGRVLEHGTLGITVRRAGTDLLIDAIQDFSPADAAGLRLGDVLLEVAGRPVRTANEFNNVQTILPARWPATVRFLRDGEPRTVRLRTERLSLRLPEMYLLELEHNYAEIAAQFARAEQLLGLHTRADAVGEWELHVSPQVEDSREGDGGGLPADGDAGVEADGVRMILRLNPPLLRAGGATTLPATWRTGLGPVSSPDAEVRRYDGQDDDALGGSADVDLVSEWNAVLAPLLAHPTVGFGWEMLEGDEVEGRIATVIERRYESGMRIRWKFGYFDDVLLEATLGDDEQPERVAWVMREVRTYPREAQSDGGAGGLRFPSRWVRREADGAPHTWMVVSATPVAAPATAPAEEESGE